MSRERDRHSTRSSRHQDVLIKLRGIPASATKNDIKSFLRPCHVINVHLFNNDQNKINECFVDLDSERDLKDALKKHKTTMERRLIEVLPTNKHEFKFFIKHKGAKTWSEPVIRLEGLPSTCTMADIQNFFQGVDIANYGIYITRDMSDEACGGGYVAFVDMDHAYKAIDLFDQELLKDSVIKLCPSSYQEAKETIMKDAYLNGKRFADENEDEDEEKESKVDENPDENQPEKQRSRERSRSQSPSRDRRHSAVKRPRSSSRSPEPRSRSEAKSNNQNSRTRNRSRSRSPVRRSSPMPNEKGEYVIKMRGMPFTVKDSDIMRFFPSSCRPVRVEILYDRRTKRPNGDGYAYFTSRAQVYEAKKCDRQYMRDRYIELYFDTGPRSSTQRLAKKNSNSPRPASRSPAKSDNGEQDGRSHSRSESEQE